MINEEIVGGLKSALERGQSLQSAMIALYNSGYKKEEIEEAARSLMQFSAESQIQQPVRTVPKKPEVKTAPQILTAPKQAKSFPELQTPIKPLQQQPQIIPKKFEFQKPVSQIPQMPKYPQSPAMFQQYQSAKPIPSQRVSSYGEPVLKQKAKVKEGKSSKEKIVILVLVFLLIFLFGLLGAIFIFKQQLIDIFSSFFS